MREQGAPAAAACLPLCLAASRLAPPRPSARAALASSLASPSPLSLPASRFAPRRDARPPWASRLSLPPPRPRCLRVSPSAPLPSQSCAAPLQPLSGHRSRRIAPSPERLLRLPPECVAALPQAIAEQAVATSRCARAHWHCTATSPPLEGRHRRAARFFDAGAACSRGQAATGRPRPRRAVPRVRVVPVILAALLRRHRCRSCRPKP